MKRRLLSAIALALVLGGCAGAGPASGTVSGRPRCASSERSQGAVTPLFYLMCIETP